jgi:MinD-like ATPase involved in chromosome partitioning or flagellar assembly
LRPHPKANMKTITFYSYKGGTGRSLALANAARYLARLEFKVVALDFDLEAPGLQYKFSSSADGKPLPVQAGIVDYLHGFIVEGQIPNSLKDFTLDVTVPGADKPLIQLIPAGRGPSKEYWSKLSRINWHELFYSKGAKGVQVFLDLKNRIADELKPDFLLVDSRTGITEMGGVATTLLADKVITLVLPSRENLEGARAVLRSLRRSRRESGADDLEIIVALSRLPQMKESEGEQDRTERIRTTLNEEADDLKDTLSCSEVFVLHSEEALEIRESLRVGSGVSPDDSILLRDYLRLFANVVPRELIEPKVGKLIHQAREKIWEDPEGALKEVEELAESFGHPENYRALLRFYEVRNVGGTSALKRAQRLWELTRDSNDGTLWQVLLRAFEPKPRWRREKEWTPDLDFVEAVWRDAGKRNPEFGMKVAEAYNQEDRESRAADVLLEVIKTSEPTAQIASSCIAFLDVSKRVAEANAVIQQLKPKLVTDPSFVEAWAKHALRNQDKDALAELVQPPTRDQLGNIRPYTAAQVFFRAGLADEAGTIADKALREFRERPPGSEMEIREAAELFQELGRWEDFERTLGGRFPPHFLEEIRDRFRMRRRGR